MQSIYLAGFDVFRPNALAFGNAMKTRCLEHGFVGLFPLDNVAPSELSGPALAQWIYQANIKLIEQADFVIANINPFRGKEPDSGTAFEIGYATALGKPVWAYTDQSMPLIEQVKNTVVEDGARIDSDGYLVEDFGLNINLMIACSAQIVVGDFEACLEELGKPMKQHRD